MNLKKKFVVGAASVALIAGMGIPAANAATIVLPGGASYDPATHRVAGVNRVETSIQAAIQRMKNQGKTVADIKNLYLVGYNAQVDAATAGQISDNAGAIVYAPVGDAKAMKLFGLDLKAKKFAPEYVVAIGGTGVISDENLKAVTEGLAGATTPKTKRIGGANRYETAVKLASDTTFSASQADTDNDKNSRVYIANGQNFVDALGAGAIEDTAALILVPPTGDIPKVVSDYYKGLNIQFDGTNTNTNVVVLGGTGAVPDEQVLKLLGITDYDIASNMKPWTALDKAAKAKEDIQKAAASYFGQYWWQAMAKTTLKPIDPNATDPVTAEKSDYYGLADSHSDWDQASGDKGTNVSESSIDITKKVDTADPTKAFVGYLPGLTKYTASKTAIDAFIVDGNASWYEAVSNAVKEKATLGDLAAFNKDATTLPGIVSVTDAASAASNLAAVFQNYYGAPIATSSEVNRASVPYLQFGDGTDAKPNTEDDVVTGMNTTAINDLIKTMQEDTTTLVSDDTANTGTTNTLALNKTAEQEEVADLTWTAPMAALTAPVNAINFPALQKLVQAKYDEAKAGAEAAKAKLDSAVAYAKALQNVVDGVKVGPFTRLEGANRYETSALLSWWLYASQTTPIMSYASGSEVAYLASGEDAHLADSVVAGQLTGSTGAQTLPAMYGGPILLVPTSGDVNADVAAELARLGKEDGLTPNGVYAVGGTGAVADSVMTSSATIVAGTK